MRGLYIHLPFCNAKCPYCAFYSVTSYNDTLINNYLDTCIKHINHYDNKSFDTIYLGGGTPSAIPTKILSNFIDKILNNINYSGVEFTIEANPESVTDEFIHLVKTSDISRVSLGVQSFNDNVLKLLGRIHDASLAENIAKKLLDTQKDINLDMIFDIPNIDSDIIFDTANKIVSLSPAHVSAYSYSSKDRGYLEDIDENDSQFEQIEHFFNSHNIQKYETSNFAKIGHESKHNVIYWTMQEYIGIGVSAHSMQLLSDSKYARYSAPHDINAYINNFINNEEYDILSYETGVKEAITLGLRMVNGVDINHIKNTFGNINKQLDKAIQTLVKQQLLTYDNDILKTTKRGALILDSVSAYLWQS